MPDCNAVFPSISTYPGEDYMLRLAVVGTMNGTVPGTVHAKFPPSSPQARLGDLQDTQPSKHALISRTQFTPVNHRFISISQQQNSHMQS